MEKDLTTGKITPQLIGFTIPLVLGNLFQLTYNAVDSIIVGRYVGKEALAAVGICNPISTLFILFLNGLFIPAPKTRRSAQAPAADRPGRPLFCTGAQKTKEDDP